MHWDISSPEAMRIWGEVLGGACQPGTLIYLSGDLGAGKTTLAGGILAGYGHPGRTKSPTYTLVEVYETSRGPVYHFDLYRLEDPEELDMMGFRDYLSSQSVCLVEWPERAAGYLSEPDLHLGLELCLPSHRITLLHASAKGSACLRGNDR